LEPFFFNSLVCGIITSNSVTPPSINESAVTTALSVYTKRDKMTSIDKEQATRFVQEIRERAAALREMTHDLSESDSAIERTITDEVVNIATSVNILEPLLMFLR